MTDAILTTGSATTAPAQKAARLVHIDGARGYLLIAMFIAHFNFTHWTPVIRFHHGNFSPVWDGEFFVLLSGFVCALSYLRPFSKGGMVACELAVLKRLRWVYLYQIIVALSMLYLFVSAWPMRLDSQYVPDLETPLFLQSLQVFTFAKQPLYLGILILYMMLMLFIPVGLWLLETTRTRLFFGILAACWLVAAAGFDQAVLGWIFAHVFDTRPFLSLTGIFNPLSYAVIFYGGFYLGYRYKTEGWDHFKSSILPTSYPVFYAALAITVAFAVAEAGRGMLGSPEWLVEPKRRNVSGIGLISLAAISYIFYFLLNREDLAKPLMWARAVVDSVLRFPPLVMVGRNSLFVYSGHVVAVFTASYFILSNGFEDNRIVVMVVQICALAALLGAARLKKRYLPALP